MGVVGAGEIVAKTHLPVLRTIPTVSVDWLTDLDFQKARAVADAFGVRKCVLPEDLMELPPSDIVLIAVPYGVRAPYYKVFRQRLSALYVEKPFARTVDYHRKICSWFPEFGLACGLQRRCWGPLRLVKQIITTRLFGSLRSVRYGFGGPGLTVGGRYNADLQTAGGGPLFESAVHGIDAILFSTDAVGTQVKAATMIMDGGFDLHTTAEIVLVSRYGDNILVEVTVSVLEDTLNGLEYVFENAVICLSFSGKDLQIRPKNATGHCRISPGRNETYPLSTMQTMYAYWCRFLEGLRSQQTNETSATQAVLTTKVIEELYRAGKGTDQQEAVYE